MMPKYHRYSDSDHWWFSKRFSVFANDDEVWTDDGWDDLHMHHVANEFECQLLIRTLFVGHWLWVDPGEDPEV